MRRLRKLLPHPGWILVAAISFGICGIDAIAHDRFGGFGSVAAGDGYTGGAVAGIIERSAVSGVTASTTQTQGQNPITVEYNQISVTANPSDVCGTLPTAIKGATVFVINDGANACGVFPASGDDAGNGVDTVVSLASGDWTMFRAYDSTNWEETAGGVPDPLTLTIGPLSVQSALKGIELGAAGESVRFFDGADDKWTTPGGLSLAIDGGTVQAPDRNALHIIKGSAGTVTAESGAMIVVESAGDTGVYQLHPSNGNAFWGVGDGNDGLYHRIDMQGSNTGANSDKWRFFIANGYRINISTGEFQFLQAETISTSSGNLTLDSAGTTELKDTVNINGGLSVNNIFEAKNASSFGGAQAPSTTRAVIINRNFATSAALSQLFISGTQTITSSTGNLTILHVAPLSTTINSGNAHPLVYSAYFAEPDITETSGSATEAGVVFIDAPPDEGGTNFSLHVVGAARFDATLDVQGTSTSFTPSTANGFKRTCTSAEETLTFAASPGDATKTTTGMIPDGATAIAVAAYTLVLGTNCTSADYGDGADVDLYADNTTLTVGTTVDPSDYTATLAWNVIATSEVVITGVGGNCFDLSVRVVAHYCTYTAPTD